MYNLCCLDHLDENVEHRKDCGLCDEKGNVKSEHKDLICPHSKKLLKVMGECVSGGYLRVSSMTPDQKQVVLKKRAHEHFKKNIEEKKHEMNKQFNQQANSFKK